MSRSATLPGTLPGQPAAPHQDGAHQDGAHQVRPALPEDLEGARSVMLDTFYYELGCGYQPAWHADVVDLAGTYLAAPRHLLLVAVAGAEVVATTAVRPTGPRHPPHPRWLARRYPDGSTAQLFRVYVRPAHRRRGLARALVQQAVRFVAADPLYRRLYLHTDTRVPGAEAFWRSVAQPIYDARDGEPEQPQTVHFEIPLRGLRDGDGASSDGA